MPGHERFIRNMLAGASGLDLAMLVVAADDSVMPQTREHLEILRLLGLSGGLIVLTKCDLAEPSWIGLVEDEIRELVRGTFLETAADRADLGGDRARPRRAEGRAGQAVRAASRSGRIPGSSAWRSTGRSPWPGMGRW